MSSSPDTRITFSIPFYSGRAFLERTLRSVLAQDDDSWLAVVCDDGSEAGVKELVASFGDARLRYQPNPENIGMGRNFNQCIDVATTDLVVVLHADDELKPSYCRTLRAAASRHPAAAALFCQAQIIGEDSEPRFSVADTVKSFLTPKRDREVVLEGEPAMRALLQANFIYAPTLCFRKSVLGDRRFPPEYRFVLDWELTTRILLDGLSIVGLPDVCYLYRRHSDNATERLTRSNQRFQEESAFYDRMERVVQERGWLQCAKVARERRVLKLNVAYRTLKSAVQLQFKDALNGLKLLREL